MNIENYKQLLQDMLRILRISKLAWVFGFLYILTTLVMSSSNYFRGIVTLACAYLIVQILGMIISIIAQGGLIYLVHQTVLDNRLTFKAVWRQGWARLGRNTGLIFFLFIPALLAYGMIYFIIAILTGRVPISMWQWPIAPIMISILDLPYSFGICAIMIDGVKAGAAARTGLHITVINIVPVLGTYIGILFIRLLGIGLVAGILATGLFKVGLPTPLAFDFASYQKLMAIPVIAITDNVINLLLYPLTTIIWTLLYIKFTKEFTYPALVKP